MPPTRKQIACLAHEMLSQVDCTNPTFADLPFNLEWAARRDVTLAGNVVLVLGMYQEMMFLRLPEIFDENTTFQDTLETSKETLKQLHAKHPHGFDAASFEEIFETTSYLLHLQLCGQTVDLSVYCQPILSALHDLSLVHKTFETQVRIAAEERYCVREIGAEFDVLGGLLEHIKHEMSKATDFQAFLLDFYRENLARQAIHPTACALALLFHIAGKENVQQTHADTREEHVPASIMSTVTELEGTLSLRVMEAESEGEASDNPMVEHLVAPTENSVKDEIPLIGCSLPYDTLASNQSASADFKPLTKVSFTTMQEWADVQANAAYQEHLRQQYIAREIGRHKHNALFVRLSPSRYVVGLLLNPETPVPETYRPSIGSVCELTWSSGQPPRAKQKVCTANVTATDYGLPAKCITLLSTAIDDDNLPTSDQWADIRSTRRVDVSVSLYPIDRPCKHRIETIRTIKDDVEMVKWHNTILAQDRNSLGWFVSTNVNQNDANPQAALDDVQHCLPKIDWAFDQMRFLSDMALVQGRVGVVSGVAGSGKSLLVAACATVFARLDLACLVMVPSAAAGETLAGTFTQWNVASERPVQFVNASTSAKCQEILKDARVKSMCLAWRPCMRIAARTEGADDLSAEIFEAKSLISRCVEIPEHFLFRKICDAAFACGENGYPMVSHLFSKDEAELLHKQLKVPLPADYQDSESTSIDIYVALSFFLTELRMQVSNVEWTWALWRLYDKLMYLAEKHQLSRADVVITSSTGPRLFPYDLGELHPGIVILYDDSFRNTELDTLMPLAKLRHRRNVTSMFLFGDFKQPCCSVMPTPSTFPQCPSLSQLALPFGKRLIEAGHNHHQLLTQHRMAPFLSE